ncbi:hypothetical protein Y032_0881g2835 [Ancylostoma ceylanicum]|uniref:Uncharacterized protein n=1 Tax=Ancylostoma ceylanicum TaxID=53326 RepID=A0A016WAG4_9BILA|nr:hypothetical protein Y032_0881g2835 [Ancylostoma ceylanicum]
MHFPTAVHINGIVTGLPDRKQFLRKWRFSQLNEGQFRCRQRSLLLAIAAEQYALLKKKFHNAPILSLSFTNIQKFRWRATVYGVSNNAIFCRHGAENKLVSDSVDRKEKELQSPFSAIDIDVQNWWFCLMKTARTYSPIQ